MALSASIIWNIRTGGADTNGGGFKSGATGTDYSKQNAPQYTPTTTLTSAGAGAVILYAAAAADMVGNLINITAGTNFVTGWFEIISAVAGVSITTDRNSTTGVGAVGSGNIGGGMATPEAIDPLVVPGNLAYIEAGSYTKTTTRTLTCDGTIVGGEIAFVGCPAGGPYSDIDIIEGSMPVFTTGTNSIAKFSLNGVNRVRLRNIKVTDTAGTRGDGFTFVTANSTGITIENCVADGCLRGFFTSGNSNSSSTYSRCVARNCTSIGFQFGSAASGLLVAYCLAYANAGYGFVDANSGGLGITFYRCISYANTGAIGFGFGDTTSTSDEASPMNFIQCVAYANAQSGFRFAYTTGGRRNMLFDNCVSYGNTVSEMSCATAGLLDGTTGLSAYPRVRNLAVKSGGGSSGERVNFRQGEGYIQLTADPFTNGSGGDFSPNSTPGGGQLLRNLGYPTEIGIKGSSTATYPNVGVADPAPGCPAFASV